MTSRGSSARHRGRAQPEPERAWPPSPTGRGCGRYPGHRNENIQRYLFDAALVFNVILTLDAIMAVDWAPQLRDGSGQIRAAGPSCCGSTRCRVTPAVTRPVGVSTTSPPTRSETDSGLWLPRSTRTTATSPGPR